MMRVVLRQTIVVALLVLVADQVSKWAMLELVDIAHRDPIIVTAFFKLVMVWNYGISFGMLAHPGTAVPWFLQAVAVGISAVLLWLACRTEKRYERLAYGLIIGGALGNVIDRFRFGAVADFFSFHLGDWHYPAFNVADAAIFCGVMWLIVCSLRASKEGR
jgi:signal peptidase II